MLAYWNITISRISENCNCMHFGCDNYYHSTNQNWNNCWTHDLQYFEKTSGGIFSLIATRPVFLSTYVESRLFSLPWSCLSSLLDLLFLDPHRENDCYILSMLKNNPSDNNWTTICLKYSLDNTWKAFRDLGLGVMFVVVVF